MKKCGIVGRLMIFVVERYKGTGEDKTGGFNRQRQNNAAVSVIKRGKCALSLKKRREKTVDHNYGLDAKQACHPC